MSSSIFVFIHAIAFFQAKMLTNLERDGYLALAAHGAGVHLYLLSLSKDIEIYFVGQGLGLRHDATTQAV